jgi:hypothetical protein
VIKKSPKLIDKLISINSEVESKMMGFPKFYELEDIFLEFIDDGWNISFDVRNNDTFGIEISNCYSELNITMNDYYNLKKSSKNIVQKIKNMFNMNCDIVDYDYYTSGSRNIGTILFELSNR